jgi:hypothetical protein
MTKNRKPIVINNPDTYIDVIDFVYQKNNKVKAYGVCY